MRGKMRSKGADRQRIRSKYVGSDASDDDYKIEDDREFDDSEEYCSSLAGEELEDGLLEDKEEEKVRVTSRSKRRNGFPTKSRGQVGKACKKRKVSYKEDSGDEYLDDDDDRVEEEEDAKDWATGFPKRKRNGAKKAIKEKKASYIEANDDDCKAEHDNNDDDDYSVKEDDEDLWKGFPRRKQNGFQKVVRKKKAAYMEENDDDYEIEGDECDDDDDYVDNEDEKDLRKGCRTRKQNEVQKALKKKKASHTEENDDDYEAEDDDYDDEDYYDNEEDEVEEVEEEDEDEGDFTSDETDFDDEDELVMENTKKVKRIPSQGRSLSGEKKRRNSRVINKSKRKKPTKKRGFQRKLSSGHHNEAAEGKSSVKGRKARSSGPKRRRLVVDSDSDFVDVEPLLDQEYTISEEEREQVREASRFCGLLDVTLKNSSPKKRSREEGGLHQERKQKARKGKDKAIDSKKAAAKQVCGICFSEEGKRTIRGTLNCCSHYFCFNCIMEWSKVESRCPLCKQRFGTISKPGRSDTVSGLRAIVVTVPERDQVYQPSEEELRAYLDPYENVICTECHHGGDDANMLLCDLCDSPAHTYCVGLYEVPEGNWYCEGCRPTALGPSNPEATTFTRERRTSNDRSARSSHPENVREAIDLNRVYEPETPLTEGNGMSPSPRPVDADLRTGSSVLGAGVQTVSERRRRHRWFTQFASSTSSSVRLGPEVEWGRTRRIGFQGVTRPITSSLQTTFSQGLLHDLTSPMPSMHLLPVPTSHSAGHRVWGQTFTGVTGSGDGSGSLPAGLAGIRRSGAAWSIRRHSPMQ